MMKVKNFILMAAMASAVASTIVPLQASATVYVDSVKSVKDKTARFEGDYYHDSSGNNLYGRVNARCVNGNFVVTYTVKWRGGPAVTDVNDERYTRYFISSGFRDTLGSPFDGRTNMTDSHTIESWGLPYDWTQYDVSGPAAGVFALDGGGIQLPNARFERDRGVSRSLGPIYTGRQYGVEFNCLVDPASSISVNPPIYGGITPPYRPVLEDLR